MYQAGVALLQRLRVFHAQCLRAMSRVTRKHTWEHHVSTQQLGQELGLESIDQELLEAARTMGANNTTTFRTVVLPMVAPYMVAGFAFAFVLSMNEFIISFFLGQFAVQTLPVKIFSSLRSGYTPTIASVSVMFILLAVIVFGLVARFGDLPRLLGAWAAKDR